MSTRSRRAGAWLGMAAAMWLLCGAATEGRAQAVAEPLVVATREAPPFAMRDVAGNWEGLSVELWQDVADRLNLEFEWREMELGETLEGLARGEVDVAVSALSVTGEREEAFDFSHPYYSGGLALAEASTRGPAWVATLRSFFSREFLSAVGMLALVLLVAGAAIWLFERRRNRDQFGSGWRGLGDGFWWSAVTMTTVGYGDKAPVSLGGRIVALVWMFASLIVIASFTAAIAASVTVHRLGSDLLQDRRLSQLRIATLSESAGGEYAEARGFRARTFPSLEEAVEALRAGDVDAILHDAPILKYFARTDFEETLEVLPGVLVRDDYAFGLPEGSPLRESLNVALLSILHEPVWQNIKRRYLGEEEEG